MRPIHSRASLQSGWSHVDRAIEPPEPATFAEPEIAARPAQRITPEDIGRAWAQLKALLEPVLVFFQRVSKGYREADERGVQ